MITAPIQENFRNSKIRKLRDIKKNVYALEVQIHQQNPRSAGTFTRCNKKKDTCLEREWVTHFAALAAGDSVVIAARLVAADLARHEALGGRRAVRVRCRVVLLCKKRRKSFFFSRVHRRAGFYSGGIGIGFLGVENSWYNDVML